MKRMSGGQALRQAIHVARARTDITSDAQLALRANVSYDTFMNWYGDKTTPRPHEVKKVADVLGVRYGDLLAAWEGHDPEPQPLHEALRDLVGELRRQNDTMAELVRLIAADREPPAPVDPPESLELVGNGAGRG
jgi:transcriptional regulator with XRE-family HTH domain